MLFYNKTTMLHSPSYLEHRCPTNSNINTWALHSLQTHPQPHQYKNAYRLHKFLFKQTSARNQWKFQIMHSIISAQALYGLQAIHLYPAQHRQLVALQDRTLRLILGITAAYKSKVSQEAVWKQAKEQCPKLQHITTMYWRQRTNLLYHVLRRTSGEWEHDLMFNSSGEPTVASSRKVGRPRFTWLEESVKHVFEAYHPGEHPRTPLATMITFVRPLAEARMMPPPRE